MGSQTGRLAPDFLPLHIILIIITDEGQGQAFQTSDASLGDASNPDSKSSLRGRCLGQGTDPPVLTPVYSPAWPAVAALGAPLQALAGVLRPTQEAARPSVSPGDLRAINMGGGGSFPSSLSFFPSCFPI